jgi:predicted nucleic acid-binding protein
MFDANIYPELRVEWVDARCHEPAMRILLAANRERLSLVDCVSFVFMRRVGINSVFCFDDHFREQGFDVIPNGSIR